MDQAKKLGAKGQLPHAWWELDSRFERPRRTAPPPRSGPTCETEAQRLLNAAAFIEEMRKQKSGMEAMLGRFDQALAEIGTLYGMSAGSGAERHGGLREDLIDRLNAKNLQRQVLIDSLTVANRRFNEIVGGRAAAQESLITALQVEVSRLRRQLWETELRVGVAEADRSAAETVLTQKQATRSGHRGGPSSFTAGRGGDPADARRAIVVMRVFGMSFGVGSAELSRARTPWWTSSSAAIAVFPGAEVRVEGHTDDTGSREANLRLSRRRAETVARLLETEAGRAEGSIATEGFGPDRPVALNSTPRAGPEPAHRRGHRRGPVGNWHRMVSDRRLARRIDNLTDCQSC